MKNILISGLLILGFTTVYGQKRETRDVAPFTKISFRFPGKLYLKQGSPQKVELEGDEGVLKEVETTVKDGSLVIANESWFNNWGGDNSSITAYITVPEIQGLRVAGSGDIIGQSRIKTNDLQVSVSGSGSILLDVEAQGDIDADVSGSGELELTGNCHELDSDVSGSGNAILKLNVKNQAEFEVSGSGKILAKGSARAEKIQITGSGKVLAADFEVDRCIARISGSGDAEVNVKSELDANISGSGSVRYKGNPNKVNSRSSGSGKVKQLAANN